MWLIVGLGNPGKKYQRNRHNVGFLVVDELAQRQGLPAFRDKFGGMFSKGDDVALLKPQTFMNLSGESLQPAAAFLKAPPASVLVIHDELDVPFSELRLKVGGGHAGHNGLRSIIERFGPEFVRLRVGIGRPPATFRGDVADYVLADFAPEERAELPELVTRAADAVERVVSVGTVKAMEALHRKAPVRNRARPEGGPSPGDDRPKKPC